MTLEFVPWRGARVPILSPGEISRYTTQDYINWITSSQGYMGPPMPVMTYGKNPVEPISNSFEGFALGMLYVDGPVAAVEAYRLRVFGQAPLLYQEIVDGRAGDLFDDEALDRLRTPWAGATLSDLMKRALIYGDFAGNAFVVDIEDELVLIRPDWVEIILEKRMFRGQQLGWKQLGIVYYEGGRGRGDGVPFLPGEYAHFIPGLPDPLATYRGMSWLTPLVREVQADKAAGDHKVAFFENSASPNLAVSLPKEVTPAQFNEFVELMDSKHKGVQNTGKTLYTGGGADVTVIGANMQQQDFAGVVGKGEPLALDTPVPTPTGWTTMGEIRPGDQVIGRDGNPANVVAVGPVHDGRDCFRVTLKDRTSVVTDASHLWVAVDRGTGLRDERVFTTREMYDSGRRYAVPATPIVELPETDLLVDPYVLGAWLGDGQTAGAAICGAAEDLKYIAAEIEARGYVTTAWSTAEDKVDVIGLPGGLLAALKALGVLGNKHIPQAYLRASVAQRLDLLRGLMDTDGTVDALARGQCSFSSKFGHIAAQFAELLRSLGYRATASQRPEPRSRTGSTWVVRFRVAADRIPFLLPRKVDRCLASGDQHFTNRRSIVEIEPVASVPVRCITVDTEDHLFLVGDGFIPTHNTRIANAGGVSPVLLSFSEGMQGSSLNAGNYTPAKRNFVDTTMRDLWANFAGSIGQMDAFKAPKKRARLWYDGRDIPFLHEDAKDLAEIQQTRASTLNSYVTNGWKPESAIEAVAQDDITLLEHTGAFSVQLQPPGAQMTPDLNGNGLADDAPTDGSAPPAPDFGALRADFWEFDEEDVLRAVVDLFDVDEEDLERAFNTAQLRFKAGTAQGGEWRRMSDYAAALLKKWARGDGPDDPLGEDDFSEAQLKTILKDFRATAEASGDHDRVARLTPPRAGRGEDPQDKLNRLKKLLYEDVRGAVRQERADRPSAKFTLEGKSHRDLDVAVYKDKTGKPALFREGENGKRGALVERFDSLDEMQAWADEHGEPKLSAWAAKESGAKAPAVKKAPAKKATPRSTAPDPDALDARLRDAKPEDRRAILEDAAKNQTQARRLASQLGVKGVSKLSRDDALDRIEAHYAPPVDQARVDRIASAFHEDWRKTRLQADGTFEPRVKKTKDQAWIDAHGTDNVDIADTSYSDLPDDWKAENRAAAGVVEGILQRHGGKVDLNDQATRLQVGEEIHQAWLSRNPWAAGGELDVPFADLPADEQAKDLDQVTVAMHALAPARKAARPRKVAKPSAPNPDGLDSTGTTGPRTGRDLVGDHAALRGIFEAHVDENGHWIASDDGDPPLMALATMQGFDSPPIVAGDQDFGSFVAKGGHTPLYRGVTATESMTAADIHAEVRGGRYRPGYGSFGNGYYMAPGRGKAKSFSDGTPGSTERYALHRDAKVIDYQQLLDEYGKQFYSSEWETIPAPTKSMISEFGRYAMARGYDAIHVPVGTQMTGGGKVRNEEYVILNRGALIVPALPSSDGLDSMDETALRKYAPEWEINPSGKSAEQLRRELRAKGAASPAVLQQKRDAADANPDLGTDPLSQDIISLLTDGAMSPEHVVESLVDDGIAEPQARSYVGEIQALLARRGVSTQTPAARQAQLDTARTTAETLADLDELVHNGASPRALEHRLSTRRKMGSPDPVVDDLLAAARADAARAREVEVENRIRAAYRDLSTSRDGYVSVQGIRDLTADLSRDDFDAAMLKMSRDREALLAPRANQKILTPAERKGAINLAGEGNHLVHIVDPSPRPLPTGDRTQVNATLDRIAREHGLTPTETAGAVVPFDRSKHELLGKDLPEGTPVLVQRRGYEYQRDGQTIRVSRATVLPATAGTPPERPVPAVDFLDRVHTGENAGLSPEDARAFAASGLSLEEWRAQRSEPFNEDDIERADSDEDGDVVEPDDDEDDPSIDEILAMADMDPEEETARAAGHDVTPGNDELHHYWTKGEGLAKWATSPKPWTTLVAHLTRHVGPMKAKIYASRWFIEVFGYAAGSDKNRVAHGRPPRGHVVGPG